MSTRTGNSMTIGVDGFIWRAPETGVAISTRHLVVHASRLNWISARITAFITEDSTMLKGDLAPRDEQVVVPNAWGVGKRMLWQHFMLPRLTVRHRVDVLYCPCYTTPAYLPRHIRVILTIHDTIAWQRPDLCKWTNALHLRTCVRQSIARADAITVPTSVVKHELMDLLRVPERKVHVIPWGVRTDIATIERNVAREIVRSRFAINKPFTLFVGRVEPKKNVELLVRIAARSNQMLVIAGPEESRVPLSESGVENSPQHVRYLGYVSPLELAALYSAAEVFVLPSHIEGFGLPIIEAMACGTPVVTSDVRALIEVCDGAALHAKPTNCNSISDCIARIVGDGKLRRDLIARGKRRASEFSWKQSATLFLRIAESLA